MKITRIFGVMALVAALSGCSSHFDMSKQEGTGGRVIYRLGQEEAFAIAYNSIVAVLPGRNITEINGTVRGYSTWFRFILDIYTQVVMVVPVKGTTSNGEVVEGFNFEISGSGTSFVQGRIKNFALRDEVQARLDDLRVAVAVIGIRGRPYKTEEELKPPAPMPTPAPAAPPPPSDKSVGVRLRELDKLYERGLISQDEYNEKRADILGSL